MCHRSLSGSVTMGVGGCLLLGIFFRRSVNVIHARSARHWVAVGGLAVFVYPFAFYPSLNMAGVAMSTVLNIGSAPLFVAMFEWALEKRRPSARWFTGAGTGMAGLLLVAVGTDAHGGGARVSAIWLGALLALAAGFCTHCTHTPPDARSST